MKTFFNILLDTLKLIFGNKKNTFWLSYVSSKASKTYLFNISTVVIGRNRTCNLRIKNPFFSRIQASIKQEQGKVIINSISKINSTKVNGTKIVNTWYLKDGDVIEVDGSGLKIFYRTCKPSKLNLITIFRTAINQIFRPFRYFWLLSVSLSLSAFLMIPIFFNKLIPQEVVQKEVSEMLLKELNWPPIFYILDGFLFEENIIPLTIDMYEKEKYRFVLNGKEYRELDIEIKKSSLKELFQVSIFENTKTLNKRILSLNEKQISSKIKFINPKPRIQKIKHLPNQIIKSEAVFSTDSFNSHDWIKHLTYTDNSIALQKFDTQNRLLYKDIKKQNTYTRKLLNEETSMEASISYQENNKIKEIHYQLFQTQIGKIKYNYDSNDYIESIIISNSEGIQKIKFQYIIDIERDTQEIRCNMNII